MNQSQSQQAALIVEEQTGLTLTELCRACAAQADFIHELIAEGAIEPAGPGPEQWRFTGVQLRHVSVAVRLQRDLGVNVAGAALALQLLDEIDTLRERLRGIGAR
ncbi:MAG: Chaperone-modulator protein CbpM [Burkholderiaceae bacterium]|jgi:chaperone modulatory protein CbpM|nr:MAG: Chaperone-modulator protein CbpM [Burkholderiaceae bacterium]